MTSLHRVRCCASGLTKTYGQGLDPDVWLHTPGALSMGRGDMSARIADAVSTTGATDAPSPPTSEIGVEGILHIDGEDAQPEGMGHFAEQHHWSSLSALSGGERLALVLTDYGPRPGLFRPSCEPLHGPRTWNTVPSGRTARTIAVGEGA